MDFVGQKFNLKKSQHTYLDMVYDSYELDDPAMEQKIYEAYGEETRIFPPGTCGTADWKPFRMNVHINEDGIITGVDKG